MHPQRPPAQPLLQQAPGGGQQAGGGQQNANKQRAAIALEIQDAWGQRAGGKGQGGKGHGGGAGTPKRGLKVSLKDRRETSVTPRPGSDPKVTPK